jgi:N-acetyl sugar amidotransferase
MNRICYPEEVDFKPFSKDNLEPMARYGLPAKVEYCRKCAVSNQKPNSAVEYNNVADSEKVTINFDSNRVCDPCNFAERKSREINWFEREQQLRELCDRYRRDDGYYDCIVPGSGGKDSVYASHILKTKFGMHPLTVTWAPHIFTDWGRANFESWIRAGHDNYLFTPNGQVQRVLTRLSTELLFYPFQAFEIGIKSFPPKMAIRLNIPLVFYGENEAEYGNPISDTETPIRDESYFTSENTNQVHLSGLSLDELKSNFGFNQSDLQPYLPVDPNRLAEMNIEIHHLGYYLKWDSKLCYNYAVEHCGFKPAPTRSSGSFSNYWSIDDKLDDINWWARRTKFGLGRASYDAAQEIRSGSMNRNRGIFLIKEYDHEYPERFIDELFAYLTLSAREFPVASSMFEQPIMDRKYFQRLTDKFRSPHLWFIEEGIWKLRQPISDKD